jgi:predicted TPR repeat methyltransferase
MALAEHYASAGETDKAIEIYGKVVTSSPDLKQGAEIRLAQMYEKVGQTEKAVESYFEIAKADRTTPAGSEAEKRLAALAPDRVKDLPPIDPTTAAIP